MKKSSMRLSKDGKALIVKVGKETELFSVNLVKYHLGISYTKKDGSVVTESQIKNMKSLAQENYITKINNNKTCA